MTTGGKILVSQLPSIPADEPVFLPEGTEPVIPPPSTDITIGARITVRPQTSISLPPEVEVERLLTMTTPSPSHYLTITTLYREERLAVCTAPLAHSPPLPPSSGCPTQIQPLGIASTQALIDAVTAALPSSFIPPYPHSLLYHHLFGQPEQEAVPEIAPMTVGEVNTRVTELAELHERDTQDLYALLEDAQDRLSQVTHQELQTYRDHVQIMAPTTKRGPNTPVNDTNPNNMTPESIQAMIDQDKNLRSRGICNDLGSTQEKGDGQVLFRMGESRQLEIELWEPKVCCYKNEKVDETEKVDKYISGLPDNIYGNIKSARPKTLDETIELANDLMDQKLRTYAERQCDNKRKADDSSINNHGHQQQPFKRQNVAKVYNMGTGKKKPYEGSLPKCTKCHFYHNGPCTQKCHKCNKVGHFARDYRSTSNTNVANTQKGNGAAPKGNGCFECGALGHFKRDCPKLKNKDGGNGNAQG
ncbi:putative reverse transcriptase domain-containing protein [Tanacetum coccineum]